ncbi:MAG: Uma2 family endonuclease [Acidimicrobiales bacterium]
MTTVLASTETLPELLDALARRHELGLDTYDEWWEAVYRVVTGPSPEHGELVARLAAFLLLVADAAGLKASAPANIGRNRDDCRVPDLAVFRSGTPRTSPAFLASAELVIEVLSPGEEPGAKLDFYARFGVSEYLEVDPPHQRLRLLRRAQDRWEPASHSAILGFDVRADGIVSPTASYHIAWPPA